MPWQQKKLVHGVARKGHNLAAEKYQKYTQHASIGQNATFMQNAAKQAVVIL
jgi:hypothetical protein